MSRQKKIQVILILIFFAGALSACFAGRDAFPTPTATPTQIPSPPRNDNVEALNAAQAAMGKFEFGLAPLLLEEATYIEIEDNPGELVARMNYPAQPAAPTDWLSVDSFALAYSVRESLANVGQVDQVALGTFGVSASVENRAETVDHTAAWVTFVDGSRAVVDLSPLSTNFAARHIPGQMLIGDKEIEDLFAKRRKEVNMARLQPMSVIEQNGEMFYLLARVVVTYHRYEFSLYLHPVQPADPMRQMELRPGITAGVEIDRSEFEKLQALLLDAGPAVFNDQPDLLIRRGNQTEPLSLVMDENLYLLWHLITKFRHQLPDPNLPTPTPAPTATPIPTATPTPTATPRKMPLLTS